MILFQKLKNAFNEIANNTEYFNLDSIYIPLSIFKITEDRNFIKYKINTSLSNALRVLDYLFKLMNNKYLNQIEVIETIIDNMFLICRTLAILKDFNQIITRILRIKKYASFDIQNEHINQNLDQIIARMKSILYNKDKLLNLINNPTIWKRKKANILETLDNLESRLNNVKDAKGSEEHLSFLPIEPKYVLFGKEIGFYIYNKLLSSQKRIIIFSQTVHDAKIRICNKVISLIDLIITKAMNGVKVCIMSRHPDRIPGINISYLSLLTKMYHCRNIQYNICWHMHMKAIVIDDTVIIGSANFTTNGLNGFGEIAVVINSEKYANFLEEIFIEMSNKTHKICQICQRKLQTPKICGNLKQMLKEILTNQLMKARKREKKLEEELISYLLSKIGVN